MGGYSLGGKFTTVEGLLQNIQDEVSKETPFIGAITGDSANPDTKKRLEEFKSELNRMINGERHFTLILDDPTGNSYLQVSLLQR